MFDLIWPGRRPAQCNGVTRRDMLRVGGLSVFGLAGADLLRLEASAAAPSDLPAKAKHVIMVYLGGGLSHHDSFDPKPEAPAQIKGQYNPIQTPLPGVQLGERMAEMAKALDKLCLVRSGAHNNDHHETATNWVMSGRFGSQFGDYPAAGAVSVNQLGPTGSLPPYVAVPRNPSFTWELGKSAFLGGSCESFKAGDPSEADYKVRDLSPPEPLSESQTLGRRSLLATVDQLAREVDGNKQLAAYDHFQRRALEMVTASEPRKAFAIEQESAATRDRYGRNTFGQSCLLARRLVENGVRWVTVNFAGWDHHANIFASLDNKLPQLDHGLASLVNDLDERGLLAETLVVALGEFGRSPLVNKEGGRDHWAPAASLVFAGAGVSRGKLLGATDKDGGHAITKPVRPADVICTVLTSLGISPHRNLRTPDGRPLAILEEGAVIDELYT